MVKDAIALLTEDHKKILALLTELEASTNLATQTRSDLLDEIEVELSIHTIIESEIFYPAFKEAGDKAHEKMYHEAIEQHRAAEELVLPDLRKTYFDSEQFSGRAKVLKELIKHHVEAEEKAMFAMAKDTLTKQELLALGAQMGERKKELKTEPKSFFQDFKIFASLTQSGETKH